MAQNTGGHQLEYATPPAQHRRRFWLAPTLMWSMTMLLWIVAILFFVPRVEQILMDFKVQIPIITRVVLIWSRWVVNDNFWPVLVSLPVMVALCVPPSPDHQYARPPRTARILLLAGLLAILLSIVVLVVGLVLPVVSLAGKISGK